MGSTLGKQSPASRVSYSVRFDQNVAPATKVKYLTDGMLVNEMLADPWLKGYSCVVVDEVHERSVNCDLILGFLRRLLEDPEGMKRHRKGEMLKVVVMSATVDSGLLRGFFEKGLAKLVDGDKHLEAHEDETSEDSWSGIESDGETEKTPPRNRPKSELETSVATEHVPGRQYDVETSYIPQPVDDVYTEAVTRIAAFHTKEPLPGDILVFMTGQEDVESICSLLEEKATTLPPHVPKLLILPLYAALGPSQQQLVFQPTPARTRKVIVSTNIAESSVTIPGIRMVIDNGLVKVKEHRSALGLDSLLVKPISKSAAIQRKGRAGREGPGKCLRLYTEKSYLGLEQDNKPEILRSDLAGVVLTMKARGIEDVINFPLMDPPPRENLRNALLQLLRLDALEDDGRISKIGRLMSRLPVPPSLSRVLVGAVQTSKNSEANTSAPSERPTESLALAVIDAVAALVSEPFFIALDNLTENSKLTEEEATERLEARASLQRRQGDHLTYIAAIRSYSCENTDRKSWAEKHFINHRAMKAVVAVRKQLRAMLVTMKLLSKSLVEEAEKLELASLELESERIEWLHPSEGLSEEVLKCFLLGFTSNVARLCKDGAYRTVESNHVVRVHPASVMAARKVEGIVYSELVFTKRNYARGVSAVQLKWYEEQVGASGG